jgi:hypothetical protein
MLSQTEADALIKVRKLFVTAATVSLPPGADETHALISVDNQERFLLDLWRGTIRLSKLKFQNRARKIVVLVRLDIDGSPHANPDGTKLGGTHIHLYREGYEDRWAYPLDSSEFPNTSDIRTSLDDFCGYCNIQPPSFQGTLP